MKDLYLVLQDEEYYGDDAFLEDEPYDWNPDAKNKRMNTREEAIQALKYVVYWLSHGGNLGGLKKETVKEAIQLLEEPINGENNFQNMRTNISYVHMKISWELKCEITPNNAYYRSGNDLQLFEDKKITHWCEEPSQFIESIKNFLLFHKKYKLYNEHFGKLDKKEINKNNLTVLLQKLTSQQESTQKTLESSQKRLTRLQKEINQVKTDLANSDK